MNLQELLALALDHVKGMWRYRWHMIAVAWLLALPGWLFVYKMPDVFAASAKVSVDTNSLLPSLTQGLTADENLMSEVDLVSKALLTRPNLEDVARQTDLDLRAETPREMELLVTGLQRRVKVAGGRDKVFTITFKDRDRGKAQDVVAALLNTFMESSLGARGDDADMTERAIRAEIDDHEERLLRAEEGLADFKKRNIGYMPGDGSDYYTRLQAALDLVGETQRRIRLLRQRRDEIARQLQGEVSMLESSSSSTQAIANCSKSQSISDLRGQLSALQVDFTDKHPRIVMLRDTIAALEEDCQDELAGGTGMAMTDSSGQAGDVNSVYQNLRLLLSNAEVDLVSLEEELRAGQQEVNQLRRDVDKIADVETEMKRLNRDYAVVENRHQELLRRWETLQSKKRLDPITDKVQFNILEPPFAAAVPVEPNRPLLLVAVLILALGAGGAVAFALNQLKPVFYNRRVLSRVAGLPVLGSVSMIMTPGQVSAMRFKTFAWVGANAALVVAGGLVVAFAGPISQILRDLTRSGF